MKRHIWADPTKEWEGFRFTAYSLDVDKVWDLPLTQERSTDGKAEQIPTTLSKVYESVADKHFGVGPESFCVRITTDAEKLTFRGPWCNCIILKALLELKKEGVGPFSTLWFWYDSDSCSDDPHEIYRFFVVCGDRIVREEIHLNDTFDSGFDPTVFRGEDDSDSIWFNDSDWREANTRFWYRKFYTETRTGQLMVLRPDEPILYSYERPRAPAPDIVQEMQSVTLLKMYRLLWVALPLLVALAFPSIKDYMAVAALALGASFLWVCWETRKVGRR